MNSDKAEERALWGIIVVCGFGMLGVIGCKKSSVDGPAILFQKGDCEMGQLPKGTDVVTYDFVFTNVGKKPLSIRKVITQCSCVTTKLPQGAVAPGDKGVISVKYHLAKKMGPQSTSVVVLSNDPVRPTERLLLTASVIQDIAVSVEKMDLGWISANSTVQSDFFIGISCSKEESQKDLVTIQTSSPELNVSILGKKVRFDQWDGLVQVVICRVQYTSGASSGKIAEKILVRRSDKGLETEVGVCGTVLGAIRTEPESIYLAVIRDSAPIERTIEVFCDDRSTLGAGEPQCSCPAISIQKHNTTADRATLRVSIYPDMLTPGVIKENILVPVNGPVSLIRIPVFGWKSDELGGEIGM